VIALEPAVSVSGQIAPEDMPALAAEGVTLIVNNRPDGEEPGQPPGAIIEDAAKAAGIAYLHIPIAGGFPADRVEAMARALEEADGKVLAFCRSGTRSAWLWALARSSRGADAGQLVGSAEAVGFDLRALLPHLCRG
jgi:uncharacterized protein (TIGR01244 family)